MNYKISSATIKNLDEIYNLQQNEKHVLISYDSLKNDLQDETKNYIIAKNNDNEIIGVIGISIVVDHIDIICLLVKYNFRNQGIASSLLLHVINLFDNDSNIQNIFLEVRASNVNAITLYKKFKFEKISIRKNYYPDNGEDAYIYILKKVI